MIYIKIEYLKLINFASIYAAMRKKTLEIDLSKSKNRIVILVGANGSGKTSILGTLHPFATNGNMDDRDDSSLILEGTDGYKEIHIRHENILYVIKHYYIWSKKNKSTKSYIFKDGEDLNPNGNVTSFKDVIKQEFQLDIDYLKLIRLGNNVTNFINMKSYDRKQFSSNIFRDVDLYADMYKKISKASSANTTLLSSVGDKLRRLNITDIDESLKELEDSLKQQKKLNAKLEDEKGSYWNKSGELDTLSRMVSKDEYENKTKRFNVLNKRVNTALSPDIPKKKLKTLQKKSLEILSNKITIEKEIESIINNIDSLSREKEKVLSEIQIFGSEKSLEKLKEEIESSTRQLQELDDVYEELVLEYTKKDLLDALSICQNIQSRVTDLLSVSSNAIKKTIELYVSGRNIEKYVYGSIASLEQMSPKKDKYDLYLLERPRDCVSVTCPFYDYFFINDKPSKKKESKSFYESMLLVNSVLIFIQTAISINRDVIDKLPFKYLKFSNIVDAIVKQKPFYDENNITEYISSMEDLEKREYLRNKKRILEHEYSLLYKNENTLSRLKDSLKSADRDIISLKVLKNIKGENLDLVENDLTITQREINELETIISELEEALSLSTELHKSLNTIQKMAGLEKDMSIHEDNINTLNLQLEVINRRTDDLKYRTREFVSLNDELGHLMDDSKKIALIRKSLSANTGIPLVFIRVYLSNSKILVNNLLKIVYNGDLEILDYIVDKEFRIPYTKNGIIIDDVIRASEGEKSFISIALSFALLSESVKKYNIMLLDEIDAPLDSINRPLFIKILEKQLDMIGSEQVFMITHNNMFDSYPVDIIRTSDISLENYQDVNIIY